MIMFWDRRHGGANAVCIDPPRASISEKLADGFSILLRQSIVNRISVAKDLNTSHHRPGLKGG